MQFTFFVLLNSWISFLLLHSNLFIPYNTRGHVSAADNTRILRSHLYYFLFFCNLGRLYLSSLPKVDIPMKKVLCGDDVWVYPYIFWLYYRMLLHSKRCYKVLSSAISTHYIKLYSLSYTCIQMRDYTNTYLLVIPHSSTAASVTFTYNYTHTYLLFDPEACIIFMYCYTPTLFL